MNILGFGIGRTGTVSLKSALETLGFGPCLHLLDTWTSPEIAEAFLSEVNNPQPNWNNVYSGFNSAVGFPGTYIWRELSDLYPDAKIILTVREQESWFISASNTWLTGEVNNNPNAHPLVRLHQMTAINGIMGGVHDHDSAILKFNEYNNEVSNYFSQERLLVFNILDGWVPLCSFLGVEVPDQVFPSYNNTENYHKIDGTKPFPYA